MPCVSPCCTRCSHTSSCMWCSAKSSYFSRVNLGLCRNSPSSFGSWSELSALASALRCWWNVAMSHVLGAPPIMRSGPSRFASCTNIRTTLASGFAVGPRSTESCSSAMRICAGSITVSISCRSASPSDTGGGTSSVCTNFAASTRHPRTSSCSHAFSGSSMPFWSIRSDARGAKRVPRSSSKLGPLPSSISLKRRCVSSRSKGSWMAATPFVTTSIWTFWGCCGMVDLFGCMYGSEARESLSVRSLALPAKPLMPRVRVGRTKCKKPGERLWSEPPHVNRVTTN